MQAELQNKLMSKYPDQFKNLKYIECGDGWFDILERCCEIIQNYIDSEKKHGQNIEFSWSQIKEKFGGLRAYYYGGSEYIRGVVDMAESMSYGICEVSGNKGRLRYKKLVNGETARAWVKCLCDSEAEKEGYIIEKEQEDDQWLTR